MKYVHYGSSEFDLSRFEEIKNGEADYQFVEIMACPGGCVNGPCSL